MKRIIFPLLFICAIVRAVDPPPPEPTPIVSAATRLELAESRSARVSAQAAYDALPAEIKRQFEQRLQALNGAIEAERNASNKAIAECGPSHQPVIDVKQGVVCQPKPPIAMPTAMSATKTTP